MSKVSRSVQAGFARNERKMKRKWDHRKAAKSEDRLGLLRRKSKPVVEK